MNIQHIKLAIAKKAGIDLPTLALVRQMEEDNITPTPWLSHWDNDNRVRIVMHEAVAKAITPTLDTIAFKYELVEATQTRAAYSRYVVIIPTSVEMTF